MAKPEAPGGRRGARPVGDLVSGLLDPVLARKAGMTTGLIAAWPELVGAKLDGVTRPDKLVWPPKRSEDDPFEPATLVVACEGASVLRLQHGTSELLSRVNGFFGYRAVARIKIVQRAVVVHRPSRKPPTRVLRPEERTDIAAMTAGIENDRLRAALSAFAESVKARSNVTKG
ncbi:MULTISPECIES: DUF721 domain-containing protein [unclassified Aureimonas]|uniref:DUF721 domain-containing protein n=1 Tax=unclassified Aureimonas TaxID=2615206 RepID=UPI0006F2FFE9|nr:MULTISPECIES: DciA family protein [unclassified Aureimonas]KQT61305.1 hypothetical protein ASG54_24445 [Aureimonas sp. Leaf460]KQT68754.1 hypothetical protein ASG62_19205 [Aureimonas sp. Leaf427]